MKKKKYIFIFLIITIILILFGITFIKYKNLSINIDIIQPGNATITDDPIKGRNVILHDEGYTTIDINIKNFLNVKVYPVISDKNIIEYDEKTNTVFAKNIGEATIHFESLFGFSKSENINFIVYDSDEKSDEGDTEITTKNMKSYNKSIQAKFVNNQLNKINEIYLDDKLIDIDNFILDDRTYIDIYDYCEKIDCTVTSDNNVLYITKWFHDVKLLVTHELNTDIFKTTIQNGNQNLDFDIGSKYIDVKSCPKNGLECNNDNAYVPLRFLMQALGYTVSYIQEYNNVAINNYLYATFEANNKLMLSDTIRNVGDKIETSALFEEDKQLYLYVTDKNNIVKDYQVVLSFSGNVENGAKSDNIFEIYRNNIKLLDKSNIKNSKIKAIIIQEICDVNNTSGCGTFPIFFDFLITDDMYDNTPPKNNNIGTTTNGNTSKGYSSIYSTRGLKFTEYRQTLAPYKSLKYWSGTVSNSGCGPIAVSIINSAYSSDTPQVVINYMNKTFGYTGPDPLNKTLKHFGFNTNLVKYSQGNTSQKTALQNHLLNGGTVIMSLCTPKAGGNCSNSPSYDYANTRHIIAILDIDPNNLDSVYISNPNTFKKTGWQSLNYLLKHVRSSTGGIAYYILVSR